MARCASAPGPNRPGPLPVPPAGLEPALPAPEAGALSSELRGRTMRAPGSYSQFCLVRHLSQGRVPAARRPLAAPGLARVTRLHRHRCDGTEPLAEATVARPTRLAAVVASPACGRRRSHPRLSGELSPLSRERDRSSLCCGCRRAPSRARALTCGFVRPTCSWQLGSSSGRSQRRITRTPVKVQVRKGRLELPPRKPGLGPQPSASANSATPA